MNNVAYLRGTSARLQIRIIWIRMIFVCKILTLASLLWNQNLRQFYKLLLTSIFSAK